MLTTCKYYIGAFRARGDDVLDEAYIVDNSIDCIITDPPYPKEFLHVWKELSEFGKRVLKPSGFLVTYCPQYYLDRVMCDMRMDLTYWCQIVMTHDRARSTLFPRKEICGYKPILVFQKPPVGKPYKSFVDIIKGSGREKGLHEWQQSEGELTPLIETFTKEGDIIMDPFMGSGTTLAAALRNNRRSIGFDIDPKVEEVVRIRIGSIEG
jgi:site-specific DNA-methyltransferase (adenine-specific)